MKSIILTIIALSCSLSLHAGEPSPNQVYVAKAAFEYKGTVPSDPEKTFTANLPRGDDSAVVRRIPETSVFEISVSAPSPEAAATRANQIVLSFRDLLSDPNGTTKSVVIMNLAHPSEATPQNHHP